MRKANNSRFIIRNHGGQKEEAYYFSGAERKELSSQNPIPSEDI